MGKIVNGVANDYEYEQLEDWNKHLRYCQSNEPIILTRWQDPTIEEYQKEIARLNKIIERLVNYNELVYKRYDRKIKDHTIRSITRHNLEIIKELKEEGNKDE